MSDIEERLREACDAARRAGARLSAKPRGWGVIRKIPGNPRLSWRGPESAVCPLAALVLHESLPAADGVRLAVEKALRVDDAWIWNFLAGWDGEPTGNFDPDLGSAAFGLGYRLRVELGAGLS